MIKSLLATLLLVLTAPLASAQVLVGMTDTAAYYPLLAGKRIAVLANHTAVAAIEQVAGADTTGQVHLVDLLHRRGFRLTGIFSPEHGFRGGADAGEHVANSTDPKTGIPIRSLYNGNTRRPSEAAMRSFDVLVVDMQDVGLRFYTYYIAMMRMMEACADAGVSVVVLDRPNPNGHLVDGPILDRKYYSGVGALPIPVLHGMTMGELAQMCVGEGWTQPCDLHVVACRNYTRCTPYELPIAPSPNLPTQRAIWLYPTVCLFEGTVCSVGRGTDRPFECFGHPAMRDCSFEFTPRPTAGAKKPPFDGILCQGVDLRPMPLEEAREQGLTLRYLIDAYCNLALGEDFFTPMFEKLIGVDYVRRMIIEGASEEQIRARWQADVERFKVQRMPYLIYR